MLRVLKNKKDLAIKAKKISVFCLVLSLVFGSVFFISSHTASAQTGLITSSYLFINIVNNILSAIAQAFLQITAWILWASAEVLEQVIRISILEIRPFVESEGVLAAWRTFRDLANMMFIFILLYAAINTILGTVGIKIKEILVKVVIFALLLNFSFFFTKIAVDASNILTIGFYNQIIATKCGEATGNVSNLGSVFMCKMGLTSFFDREVLVQVSEGGGTMGTSLKILTVGFMGSTFFLIAAFVFWAAVFMFLARYIAIIYLLILSPLAFAAMALPKDKYSGDWVKKLIHNCVFPPAFMALTWAVLQILNAVALNTNGTSLANAVTGIDGNPAQGAGQVLLNYAIVIGLMIATLVVSKQFGAHGAEGALKSLKGAKEWGQGKIGRGIVRGSGLAAIDDRFKKSDFANKTRFGRSLRESTTGLVTKQKFGSKESVQDVNKRLGEADKKSAQQLIKNRERRKSEDERRDAMEKLSADNNLNLAITSKSNILEQMEASLSNPGLMTEEKGRLEKSIAATRNDLSELQAKKMAPDVREKLRKDSGIEAQEAEDERLRELGLKKPPKVSDRRKMFSRIGGVAVGATTGAYTAGILGAVIGGFWGAWAGPQTVNNHPVRKAVVEEIRAQQKKNKKKNDKDDKDKDKGKGNEKPEDTENLDTEDLIEALENKKDAGELDDDSIKKLKKLTGDE